MSSMCLMFLLRLTSPVCQIIPSLDFSSWPTCPSLIGLVGHRCQFPNINPSFLQRSSVATTPSNHFTPAVTPLGCVRDNRLFAICVAFSSQNLWGCLSSPTPSIVSLGRGTFQSAMAMVKFTIVSLGSNNCDTSKRTARIKGLKTLQDFQNYIHDFGGFTWNKTTARYEMTLWVTPCQDEYIRLLWTGLTNNSMSHFQHRFAHLPLKYALFRRTLLKRSVSAGLKTAKNRTFHVMTCKVELFTHSKPNWKHGLENIPCGHQHLQMEKLKTPDFLPGIGSKSLQKNATKSGRSQLPRAVNPARCRWNFLVFVKVGRFTPQKENKSWGRYILKLLFRLVQFN